MTITATKTGGVVGAGTQPAFDASPTGQSYLPSADPSGDPLALMYASQLVQQTVTAASDASREQVATVRRDKELTEQKKELDERDNGGRGFFGAFTHLVGDVVRDCETLKVTRLVTDTTHDISHDMINNPKFWNDLKQGAEVVGMAAGAVGSMVVTGGASAPVLIAVALSTAAMIDSKAHILQKLGVSAGAAGWIDMGAGVAGAVVTAGVSLTSTAATVSQTATSFNEGAQAVSGASQVAGGAATVGGAVLEKHNADLEADAQRSSENAKRLQQTVDWILDGMRAAQKSNQRVLSTTQQAMQTRQATSTALSTFGKA